MTDAATWARRRLDAARGRPLESIDVDTWREAAEAAGLDPAEALRQVAIAAEDALDTPTDLGIERWPALARLYDAAEALGPGSAGVLASRARSAARCAFSLDGDRDAEIAALRRDAATWARRAVVLAPSDPHPHEVLGQCLYEDPDADVADALAAFDAALALDPDHPWARLYRAHALQDLERWREAAAAYAIVPFTRLGEHATWRELHAAEQRAWCLLQAGNAAAAEPLFERVLDAWERAITDDDPDAVFLADPACLLEAAEAGHLPRLASRVARLRAALADPA